MNRHVDVIEVLRKANPVPPGAVEEVSLPLNEILGSQLGRNDTMSSTITRPAGGVETRPRWPKYLGAAAALVVAVALVLPFTSGVEWNGVATEQQAVVEQVVEALNAYDQAAFVAAFAPGGRFSTHINTVPGGDCCDTYPVEDSNAVQTWMEVSEVWGGMSSLESCGAETARTVRCQVRTQWEKLHMEVAEEWVFVFDGADLRSSGMILSRQELEDRTQPLGYQDLAEWEQWLQANDPEKAARFFTWEELTINGRPYGSVVLRYPPEFADEISASLAEYVAAN